jgi:hypothetical protein
MAEAEKNRVRLFLDIFSVLGRKLAHALRSGDYDIGFRMIILEPFLQNRHIVVAVWKTGVYQ